MDWKGSVERKYQVFVSSTYEDLQEERREVIHVLLELDCIPSGMELFPAADEDQWSLIKGVIDDCDYYIVIIAGRYGSIGPDGVSYTEMEYRYAVENNKPAVAFLHGDTDAIPNKHTEKTAEGREKLRVFCDLVQKKMCKKWKTPHELGSVVGRSLTQLRKRHPGVGWVRGDQVPDREATEEILSLRKQIEHLEHKLNEVRTEAPLGTEQLAQGDDIFQVSFLAAEDRGSLVSFDPLRSEQPLWKAPYIAELRWDDIFYTVLPLMIIEAAEVAMRIALERRCSPEIQTYFSKSSHSQSNPCPRGANVKCHINNESFRTILVQLRALGLIQESPRTRSVKDKGPYWTLTPFGDNVMNRLRAIKRTDPNEP